MVFTKAKERKLIKEGKLEELLRYQMCPRRFRNSVINEMVDRNDIRCR